MNRKGIYFSYDATLALTALMIGMIAITQFAVVSAETPSDQIQTSDMKITAEDATMTAQHKGILKEIQEERVEGNDDQAQQTAEQHFNQKIIHDKGYSYGIRIETETGTEELVPIENHESATVTNAILPQVQDQSEDEIKHANQIQIVIYQ